MKDDLPKNHIPTLETLALNTVNSFSMKKTGVTFLDDKLKDFNKVAENIRSELLIKKMPKYTKYKIDKALIQEIAWHPDGTRLAYLNLISFDEIKREDLKQKNQYLNVLNTDSLVKTKIGYPDSYLVEKITWDNKGTSIISCSTNQTIRLWDSSPIKQAAVFKTSAVPHSMAYHPKNPIIAFCLSNGEIRLWNADTHTTVGILKSDTDEKSILNAAWHPDGTILASCCKKGTIQLWDTSKFKEIIKLNNSKKPIIKIAWNNDGTALAYIVFDEHCLKILNLASLTKDTEHETMNHKFKHNRITNIAWHPTNNTILTSSNATGTIKFWNTTTNKLIKKIKTKDGKKIPSIAWNHNGTKFAAGSWGSTIYLWQLAPKIASLEKLSLLECFALLNKEKNTETYKKIPKKIQDAWEKEE